MAVVGGSAVFLFHAHLFQNIINNLGGKSESALTHYCHCRGYYRLEGGGLLDGMGDMHFR